MKIELENRDALNLIFGVPIMITVIILVTIVVISLLARFDLPPIKVEIKNDIPKAEITMKNDVKINEIIRERTVVSPIEMKNVVNVPEIKIPEIKIPEFKIPPAPKAEVTFITDVRKENEDEIDGILLPPPKVK